MKCQKCSNEATIHLIQVIDNKSVEIHLCALHAQEYLDISEMTTPEVQELAENVTNQLSTPCSTHHQTMDMNAHQLELEEKCPCPMCGHSYSHFRQTNRFSCPFDYEFFNEQVLTMLTNIHGANEHTGRRPPYDGQTSLEHMKKIAMRHQLIEAISCEDYERAAMLRDKLKAVPAGL